MSAILYSFRRCPYAIRARMALLYAGISYEHREILLKEKPDHMLSISPKGTVPVLFFPKENKVMDESLDIMLWALKEKDPEGWLNKADIALIQENDTVFKKHLDRYKYPTRYPTEECNQSRDKGLEFIVKLQDKIQKNGYISKDTPSITDIAIFPFIRQFANTDRQWFDSLNIPALQMWLEQHLSSVLFLESMEKHPLFEE